MVLVIQLLVYVSVGLLLTFQIDIKLCVFADQVLGAQYPGTILSSQ